MNCFQIVSLTYLSQLRPFLKWTRLCCELLSDCIFDIPITTVITKTLHLELLWIAFRLYLWHTYHNLLPALGWSRCVVNCFQIVSLTYLSQPFANNAYMTKCCELLSDCIFDIPITTWYFYALPLYGCELLSDCIFDIPITTYLGLLSWLIVS